MKAMLVVGILALAGCIDEAPTDAPERDEELPRFQPEAQEVPFIYRADGTYPHWEVTSFGWEREIDVKGEEVSLPITVAPVFSEGHAAPAFNGSGWIVRLSGNEESLPEPRGAHWHRWLELQHDRDRNLSHELTYQLPVLEGEDDELVLRLSLRKVHEDRPFTAVYWTATYQREGDVVVMHNGITERQGCATACQWSGQPRDGSPPPPFDW